MSETRRHDVPPLSWASPAPRPPMGFVMTPPKKSTIGRARCSSCEAVCCRLTVVLHAQDAVPDELTTRTPEGLHVMKHGPDGWCVAMNRASMNCGIYESRPS